MSTWPTEYEVTICAQCGRQAEQDKEGDQVCPEHGFRTEWTTMRTIAETVTIEPPEGWRQFGCQTCGRILALPSEGDEQPWCVHHANIYSWTSPEDPVSAGWTQMVPIHAVPIEV